MEDAKKCIQGRSRLRLQCSGRAELVSLFVYNSFFFLLTEQKKKFNWEKNPYVSSPATLLMLSRCWIYARKSCCSKGDGMQMRPEGSLPNWITARRTRMKMSGAARRRARGASWWTVPAIVVNVVVHHMGSRKRLQAFLWSFISSFSMASEPEEWGWSQAFWRRLRRRKNTTCTLGFEHRIAL